MHLARHDVLVVMLVRRSLSTFFAPWPSSIAYARFTRPDSSVCERRLLLVDSQFSFGTLIPPHFFKIAEGSLGRSHVLVQSVRSLVCYA